jgi:hypothetical protein
MSLRLLGIILAAIPLIAADLRLGIIGTDTSHVIAFTQALNDPNAKDHIPGARVVAAFKGGSKDIEESASRVQQYATELKEKWSVRLVGSIQDLCLDVDGLLLESVDGRKHLAQFQEAIHCGKPVFIDKPLASTLEDAWKIARIARQANIPWFSASALRFSSIQEMRSRDMIGAIVWSPGPLEPHHALDLSWYGIHGVEMLYTLFGTGCEAVSRISTPDSDVVTARWKDGKLGTLQTQRPYGTYGAVVFLKNRAILTSTSIKPDYTPLIKQIVAFMQSKIPPVPNIETLEEFAFMDAAQKSAEQGGRAIEIRKPSL